MDRISGKVVKGLGGLFDVRYIDGGKVKVVPCVARGNLKRGDDKVYVGDDVTVTLNDDGGIIETIEKRKNLLIRPPLANLDFLFITFSAASPQPMLDTIDKMTTIAEHNGIDVSVIVTKSDKSDSAEKYARIYRGVGYETFICSSLDGSGVTEVRNHVMGKLTDGKTGAFAGASGVGKSTLINLLFPGLNLATGDISRKIQRGKHTTRHVQIYDVGNTENCGFLADTPGFSLIDFEHFDFFGLDDLLPAFPDLYAYNGKCRYADCTHTKEKECEIARAVAEGKVAESRWSSYLELYSILKDKKNYGK